MTARPAFVLAGGLSSRMGQDKAQLTWQGRSLLENALSLLTRAGFAPTVAGLRVPEQCSVPVLADRFQDSGPLGGIEAALHSVEQDAGGPALFLPVDLPLIQPELLHCLWERAHATGAWATIPTLGGRPQPLCAVYHSALAPGIAQALSTGDRKVMRVIASVAPAAYFDSFRIEALAPIHSWQNPHTWFANLNTPFDLARLQSGFGTNARVVPASASI